MEHHVPMLGISQGTKSRIPKAPRGIIKAQRGIIKAPSTRQEWGGSRLFPRHDQVGL